MTAGACLFDYDIEKGDEVTANYDKRMQFLLLHSDRPTVATHDLKRIQRAKRLIQQHGIRNALVDCRSLWPWLAASPANRCRDVIRWQVEAERDCLIHKSPMNRIGEGRSLTVSSRTTAYDPSGW